MPEELRQIEVAGIQAEAGIQARVDMDAATVTAYFERMMAGDAFPPVVVFDDGKSLWLADGFHRLAAARRAKRQRIDARVLKGTRDDAAWYALGANRANGLPMSTADKVRAVKQALLMRPEASNRMIADHVGVNHVTVAKYRSEMESTGEIHQLSKTVGADGKARPAHRAVDDDPPPPMPSIAVPTDDPPPPADDPPPPADDPPPSTDDPPPSKDDTPRDRVGNALTDPRLIEIFSRGDTELVQLCSAISKVKTTVLDACNRKDPLYAHITTGAFKAEATNVYRQIAHTRPYAVCPYCRDGQGREKCKACKGLGWVNEAIYRHVPSESRKD